MTPFALGWFALRVKLTFKTSRVGGALIVFSSYVTEQTSDKWKKRAWAGFILLAIVYAGIGIYLDYQANRSNIFSKYQVPPARYSDPNEQKRRNDERDQEFSDLNKKYSLGR